MDRCCRCKKDLGFGSVVIVEVKGEKVTMAHFFCAKPEEVKMLYGNPGVTSLSMGDPSEGR